MTSSSRVGDDTLELIDLGLGASEGTELFPCQSAVVGEAVGRTYSLLCELAGTLVLAVSQQLNDTTLVWGKSMHC